MYDNKPLTGSDRPIRIWPI